MAATYSVRVLTPEKTVFAAEIVSMVAPGSEGFLGVLAHHAPLITALRPGLLKLRDAQGKETVLNVSTGFLEVSGNCAVVLADAVEHPGEIDIERARAAAERARERLRSHAADFDGDRAEAALARALSRMRAARGPMGTLG